MNHPKMQYTYVGIDSHKDTHTAVFMDCFFDKLGEISFDNLPSSFDAFLSDAQKYKVDGTMFLFGLEDVSAYGRTLTTFLHKKDQQIKHVNALLVARERMNQNVTQKTDSIDAECAARVLLSKFDTLPGIEPDERYWILRTLVIRRDFIAKNNMSLKNHLHALLTQNYPGYRKFFGNIDCKTSLAFYMKYPSPATLKNTSLADLTHFLFGLSNGRIREEKAAEILNTLQDTTANNQDIQDLAVQSAVRQIQFNLQEIAQMDKILAEMLSRIGTTLTSMTGIETVTAAQMLSIIGDIKRFSTPAKLARYSGIAPVTYASGKKDLQFANQRGNRELNSLFFNLAVRISAPVGPTRKVINPFFYEYYHQKLSEGKTKRQAIKCVQRRLVNIIWNMLTHQKDYINPEMYNESNKASPNSKDSPNGLNS
jgi:transposase